MVMTAGLGTRLRPFTDRVSKPLLPVMSIPTIFYTLDQLADAGVSVCVCNLHSHANETRNGISQFDQKMSFKWSDEQKEILGSWGGLVTASQHLNEDRFFWLNGDVISAASLVDLSKKHQELKKKNSKLEITLLLRQSRPGEAAYRKIKTDDTSELVTGFGELEKETLYYASQSVVEKSALSSFPKNKSLDFVKDYLGEAIKRGVVGFAKQNDFLWLDVGSAEIWANAHFSMMSSLEKNKLPQSWSERLKKNNEQISEKIWKAVGVKTPGSPTGPSYFGESDYWVTESKITYSGLSAEFSKK